MSSLQSTHRLEEIEPERLSSQQAVIVETLKGNRGRVPTPFKVWLHSPSLAGHLQALGSYLANQVSLTRREAELVILAAAAHWHGDYVFSVHAKEARALGLTDAVVEAIRQNRPIDLAAARERTVLDVTRSFAERGNAADELFARAIQELGRDGLAELLALFGYFTSVSLAMKLHGVEAS